MADEVLFTHELDSRNAFGVADCGTFSPLPNGDDLELGIMPRPDIPGAPTRNYEEVWRELSFRHVEGHSKMLAFVLESEMAPMQLRVDEEREVTRTFIGAIGGTYVALRQSQILVRSAGETKPVVKSGGEVSARSQEFVRGGGFETKYLLGPEGTVLPARGDIEFPMDGSSERLMVRGQEYVVRSFEKLEMPTDQPIDGPTA